MIAWSPMGHDQAGGSPTLFRVVAGRGCSRSEQALPRCQDALGAHELHAAVERFAAPSAPTLLEAAAASQVGCGQQDRAFVRQDRVKVVEFPCQVVGQLERRRRRWVARDSGHVAQRVPRMTRRAVSPLDKAIGRGESRRGDELGSGVDLGVDLVVEIHSAGTTEVLGCGSRSGRDQSCSAS